MMMPSAPTSCSPCWSPRLRHRARHDDALDSNTTCRRGRVIDSLAPPASTPTAPLSEKLAPSTRTSATPTNDNLIHPLAKHTPSPRCQAIPHILMVKIHAVPIHQEARPGRLPSAPDGLSDWWPHRAHNKRMDLTNAHRYGAGPGASAMDRVRSSCAGVVPPSHGRAEGGRPPPP